MALTRWALNPQNASLMSSLSVSLTNAVIVALMVRRSPGGRSSLVLGLR
jgi:hypothetical protein